MNANNRTIEITVDPKGKTTVETRGFTGASCQQASRFIEQALGKTSSESLKAEFHTGNNESQTATNRQSS